MTLGVWVPKARLAYNEVHDEQGRFGFGEGGGNSPVSQALGGGPHDVSLKGMSSGAKGGVESAARQVAADYPNTTGGVGSVTMKKLKKGIVATYNSDTGNIQFNSLLAAKLNAQIAEYAMTHELAHAIADAAATAGNTSLNDPIWSNTAYTSRITAYATTGPGEAFAEVFAQNRINGRTPPSDFQASYNSILGSAS